MNQRPARSERRRLDRQIDAARKTPFDVAFGKKGDNRLAEMTREQEKIFEPAPTRFAK